MSDVNRDQSNIEPCDLLPEQQEKQAKPAQRALVQGEQLLSRLRHVITLKRAACLITCERVMA